ncbi:MAG: polyribonucleotide nucleotidyltransferase [Desulfobulbaceae bacterium]|jgi:polyribonucleotide nucleotidyltransferase|nr:polyribonucleotide nucleotidyltransferase [Desulfobulbaceae bacterium]HKJ14372.1 polyribonucleotide nucleotidyltransferase [Desulfobulbales bacterium]MDH3775450.1 polyribonucleotide nucleotidyltransferase [Desulfobulbaceae bacterium]MDH3781179.1 polyribonucleotide nucleotidyltransferase [Desulfobulbaceae bacterium]MDH3866277.1 polyribonucleotide nucleotidyltransferase [Desulfobulbaceae bacterium]
MYKKVEAEIGGRTLSIESGKMARQANGSVLVTYDETVVLVTATAAKEQKPNMGFLPLTIEYQERFYSVGRIPGSFFRREIGRPTEKETLTCRITDRPLRPLFAEGWMTETQVIATVLSADQQNDPDVLAMTGASAALTISDIPFQGPIAGVRVGYIDGQYVINPTNDQLQVSGMEIVVAGTRDAVVMVEGGADSLSEDVVMEGIFYGHQQLQILLDLQEELRAALGKTKRQVEKPEIDEALARKVKEVAAAGMTEVITTVDKMERGRVYDELKARVVAELENEKEDCAGEVKDLLGDLKKKMMRDKIVVEKSRIDGRAFNEVRPITCEVGCLPRTHGSALFTRGETQAIVTATLGSEGDEQRVETLEGMSFKQFMLHYNFPPFCVGEVRFMRGPSRRDIGHGSLAERGITAVLPPAEKFPYTMRVVSDVLESNGSSSMATVCGASLALMDGGVPIKKPVSGIAMGLIQEGSEVVILSDILGDEDHLGDMDFKVVGTSEGITSLQMDIKISGVTRDIMSKALEQAKEGRLHILDKMQEAISEPRADIAPHAPKFFTVKINPDKIRDIIGPGGKIIKGLSTEFDAKIEVDDDGNVKVFTPSGDTAAKLLVRIEEITQEAQVGRIYKGIVKTIKDFGAFVEILPGTDGLVHISELDEKRVNKVTDILKEGDEVTVKVLEIDSRGKIRLSRKAVLAEENK